MRAIVQLKYGPPESVELAEVPTPEPMEGEVLVRVHAASVNGADIETLSGWWLVRMASPRRPASRIGGSDVAGVVERVGSGVKELQPGDQVIGDLSEHGFGAFADYAVAPAGALAPRPPSLTLLEAAAVPSAAWVAIKGIRDQRVIDDDSHVLINGAGGGMGTFAVQMAAARGARVTGVDVADKLELIRSLGATQAIDHRTEDPTDTDQRYDLILDMQARRSAGDWRRVLTPDGAYLMVGGSARRIILGTLQGQLARSSGQHIGILPGWPHSQQDMEQTHELIESGKVRPAIDRTYPLARTAEALRYVADGHVRGKVVIDIAGT